MNKDLKITSECEFAGQKVSLKTGGFAMLADAAVQARVGDTVVLVTLVSRPSADDVDFLPLKIDFEERYYAGGVLSGSRFTRREGKPNDQAIVEGRLIDHAIRPLFPKDFKDDTQIVITVLSSDKINSPILVGFLGVSAALSLSGLPFKGPIVPLRISQAESKDVVYDLSHPSEDSRLDMIVSYLERGKKIQALEAHAHIVPEAEVVSAIKGGSKHTEVLFDLLEDFAKKGDVKLKEYEKSWLNEEVKELFAEKVIAKCDELNKQGISYTGIEWQNALSDFAKEIGKEYIEKEEYSHSQIMMIFAEIQKDWVRKIVLERNSRLDGRADDQIRDLAAEVGLLPRVHGSGMFTRGLTQSLSIATLGSISDSLIMQGMHGEIKKRYFHHYNFPPYSTGETGRMGGAGRREIGHGLLAEKALIPVLPSVEEFPYTIRVVSEILTSNGSTSMAATCGSTLALMDAGVPIKAPVGGIGVGLFVDKHIEDPKPEDFKLLTDIMGIEDFAGYMDFKLTGTREGMTAIQLELKLAGIPVELLDKMFEVSKTARMKVIDVIESAIKEPRKELGEFVPKIEMVKIAKDQIGLVIGSGGSTVRGLMEQTNTQIDVEETPEGGIVSIMAKSFEDLAKAKELIEKLALEVKEGEVYEGIITRIEPYGFFVELGPKQEGLVHVSEYSYQFVDDISQKVKLGDHVKAKVKSLENGKISLSMKALEEKPEGYVEPAPREREYKPRTGGFNDRRGGGGRSSYNNNRRNGNGGGYKRDRY